MILKKLFAGQKWRNKHREQTYGRGGWWGGEGGMCADSNMKTHITICRKDHQWEFTI